MNEWPANSIGRDQHSGWSNFVKGTKEKKRIFDAYEERVGQDLNHSIVSKKKGKIKLDPNLDFPHIKPTLDKWYWVSELLILNVITTVVKEHHLSSHDLKNLLLINKSFSTMIPKVLRWLQINFSPLLEPCYNYEQQEHINTSRVEWQAWQWSILDLTLVNLYASWEENTLDIPAMSIGHCQR